MNTIRATNNAIFNDIFWVHLAYVTADDGIERLRDSSASGAPLCARPLRLRGDRPGTPCPGGRERVRGGSTDGRESHLGGQRPAPRARAAHLGATQLRSPLVPVRQARLDRLGHELRGAWTCGRRLSYFTSFYLYSVTRGIPYGLRAASVAEDHPLRRPLALARDERRPPLPEIRCRHAPDRRQPAPHLRRGARLRVDPLRATASCAAGGQWSQSGSQTTQTSPYIGEWPRRGICWVKGPYQ